MTCSLIAGAACEKLTKIASLINSAITDVELICLVECRCAKDCAGRHERWIGWASVSEKTVRGQALGERILNSGSAKFCCIIKVATFNRRDAVQQAIEGQISQANCPWQDAADVTKSTSRLPFLFAVLNVKHLDCEDAARLILILSNPAERFFRRVRKRITLMGLRKPARLARNYRSRCRSKFNRSSSSHKSAATLRIAFGANLSSRTLQ
ncbi:hypothetical protein ACVWW6_000466 [Bradyrhizobium sp. USDA 3311]